MLAVLYVLAMHLTLLTTSLTLPPHCTELVSMSLPSEVLSFLPMESPTFPKPRYSSPTPDTPTPPTHPPTNLRPLLPSQMDNLEALAAELNSMAAFDVSGSAFTDLAITAAEPFHTPAGMPNGPWPAFAMQPKRASGRFKPALVSGRFAVTFETSAPAMFSNMTRETVSFYTRRLVTRCVNMIANSSATLNLEDVDVLRTWGRTMGGTSKLSLVMQANVYWRPANGQGLPQLAQALMNGDISACLTNHELNLASRLANIASWHMTPVTIVHPPSLPFDGDDRGMTTIFRVKLTGADLNRLRMDEDMASSFLQAAAAASEALRLVFVPNAASDGNSVDQAQMELVGFSGMPAMPVAGMAAWTVSLRVSNIMRRGQFEGGDDDSDPTPAQWATAQTDAKAAFKAALPAGLLLDDFVEFDIPFGDGGDNTVKTAEVNYLMHNVDFHAAATIALPAMAAACQKMADDFDPNDGDKVKCRPNGATMVLHGMWNDTVALSMTLSGPGAAFDALVSDPAFSNITTAEAQLRMQPGLNPMLKLVLQGARSWERNDGASQPFNSDRASLRRHFMVSGFDTTAELEMEGVYLNILLSARTAIWESLEAAGLNSVLGYDGGHVALMEAALEPIQRFSGSYLLGLDMRVDGHNLDGTAFTMADVIAAVDGADIGRHLRDNYKLDSLEVDMSGSGCPDALCTTTFAPSLHDASNQGNTVMYTSFRVNGGSGKMLQAAGSQYALRVALWRALHESGRLDAQILNVVRGERTQLCLVCVGASGAGALLMACLGLCDPLPSLPNRLPTEAPRSTCPTSTSTTWTTRGRRTWMVATRRS